MIKRPLIIDCDPGTDDAQCIMMLNACGLFDIRGITPVHGNVPLEFTSKNALFLSKYYGINRPVYKGAEERLIVRLPRAEYVHGSNGLGGFEYDLNGLNFADGKAWDFLYEEAVKQKGQLELVAIGPLTNIAITIMKHPDFPKLIKKFVIMGGARTAGNATPLAEFNIYQDPHAAEIVFKAGFEDFTVVDLQCCMTAYLTKEEEEKLGTTPKNNSLCGLMRQVVRHRQENLRKLKGTKYNDLAEQERKKMVFCDAAAAAVMIDPTISEYQDYYMMCETRGDKTFGQTVIDRLGLAGTTNVHLALGVDRDRFRQLYFDCLKKYEV